MPVRKRFVREIHFEQLFGLCLCKQLCSPSCPQLACRALTERRDHHAGEVGRLGHTTMMWMLASPMQFTHALDSDVFVLHVS